MFCLDCHKEFDDDMVDTCYDHDEAYGISYTWSYPICPYCGSDEIISEYNTCDCCGEVCDENYIETEDGRYYCENCYTVKNY